MQAGGRRFDPDWLHHPDLAGKDVNPQMYRVRYICGLTSRVLKNIRNELFNNLEVVLTHQIQRNLDGSDLLEPHIEFMNHVAFENQQNVTSGSLGLYDQVNKRMWWMPRR